MNVIYERLRQLLSYIYLFFVIFLLFLKKLKFFNDWAISVNDRQIRDDLYKFAYDIQFPQHVSLMSTEKRTWNWNVDFISSFINYALFTGIKQLSFCEQLMNPADAWCNIIGKNLKNGNFTLKLNGSKEIKAYKTRLIDSCKMLSKFENQLNVEDVVHLLYGDIEVDYFIIIGSNLHINYGSFPIWALRTTELHSFSNYEPSSFFHYCSLINNYNQRQRRFGR